MFLGSLDVRHCGMVCLFPEYAVLYLTQRTRECCYAVKERLTSQGIQFGAISRFACIARNVFGSLIKRNLRLAVSRHFGYSLPIERIDTNEDNREKGLLDCMQRNSVVPAKPFAHLD